MKTRSAHLRTSVRGTLLASALLLAGCPFALSDDFEITEETADAGSDAAANARVDSGTPARSGAGGTGGVSRNNIGGSGGGGAGAPPAPARDAGSPPAPARDAGPPPAPPRDAAAPNPLACGVKPLAPGGPCPAACTGGCLLGLCTIRCADDEACAEKKLDCPAGFACKVDCVAEGACEKAKVRCPEQYGCDVSCAAAGSCKGLQLECASGACDIVCGPNDNCEGAAVACGSGACRASCLLGGKAPKLQCKNACACTRCPND